ncbi:MAG: type II toxin-antitoxin system RelE/ParE family toxin [Candidatus Electrothrix aestuarii]|uniref:Type II toxin-antitoxin system RelE/ParE family toxin n=1 Tax=Candidatus Electrothrix aestuarii TaxID=3062594 RepID=A0AAU8LWB4_9BACT|nr:type II toxin-antitoxin system RelE/ParE family toxin [Candidatus Electrothrix aestuarii]
MQVKFLTSSLNDLKWFRHYYESVFPQGGKKAQKQFHSTKDLIKENPYIGHVIKDKNILEFSIPNIPFSFIYRIKGEVIEILRVWDERQDRGKLREK